MTDTGSSVFCLPSRLAVDSFDGKAVLSENGEGALTWKGFCYLVQGIRSELLKSNKPRWHLFSENVVFFLASFLAVLQAGKILHLPGTSQELVILADEPDSGSISDSWEKADLFLNSPALEQGVLDAFPRIAPERAQVILHTSGSTGKPKGVAKTLALIEAELINLNSLWGSLFESSEVWSSVSQQHLYGLLFAALLPLCCGGKIGTHRVHYPEALAQKGQFVFVSSPAFLKRLSAQSLESKTVPRPAAVFSSGGFLPEEAAIESNKFFGIATTEIYGSTETGGIAWRLAPPQRPWKAFPGLLCQLDGDGTLLVRSPYLPTSGFFRTEDLVEMSDDGFKLLGRADTVVKIEENRVALNDVENRLLDSGLVADVAVVLLNQARQSLGAVLVLNARGFNHFRSKSRSETKVWFHQYLHQFFAPVVIPKKWRFVEQLPRNAMGKLSRELVTSLFSRQSDAIWEPEISNLVTQGHTLKAVLSFPAGYAHFRGHFESLKILPALAQVDLAVKMARRYLCPGAFLKTIPRIKFVRPLFPSVSVELNLEFFPETKKLEFSFLKSETMSPFSSGKLGLGVADV